MPVTGQGAMGIVVTRHSFCLWEKTDSKQGSNLIMANYDMRDG